MSCIDSVCWSCQLLTSGWCDVIPQLLHQSNHDTREKALKALSTLQPTCSASGRYAATLQPLLETLTVEYAALAADETDGEEADQYFSSVLKLIETLKTGLESGEVPHSEL